MFNFFNRKNKKINLFQAPENNRKKWFKILPNFQESKAGRETIILKKIPLLAFLGIILPFISYLFFEILNFFNGASLSCKEFHIILYMFIGFLSFYFLFLLTLSIGCIIVKIMKGKTYVADAYELNDKDTL